jgi:eukaryotic-like serine/threonine-protein kinase
VLLNEGDVIRGSYTIERFLGEGAFAEVYRVKHRVLGRLAMKVFKLLGTMDETQLALKEPILLSKIGHRNVIRVFDADIIETGEGTRGFFTMEYVAGGSLQDFWRGYGNEFVPIDVSVDIVKQVAQGLNVAHRDDPPIVHRDIKPQNILVGYDASGLRACVSDFGLAKQVNPLMLRASARGTLCFKSPETFVDPMSDSCAGDVWAVGVTLYLLLTDRFPFEPPEGDCNNLDYRCFQNPLIPPSRLNIQVDARLDQILYRALAVKKDERYQNANELLDELESWRPRPISNLGETKENLSSENSKSILGAPTPADEDKIREMVGQAIQLARQRSRLPEAADLMEQALNKWPALREEYEQQLKLWRAGVIF